MAAPCTRTDGTGKKVPPVSSADKPETAEPENEGIPFACRMD
ncbi:MAG: hypothetical protein Q4G27_05925 [Flavobacteriaceae bacterium]|nr:hypothetical protein [Flavobacteriaceae bacterium]